MKHDISYVCNARNITLYIKHGVKHKVHKNTDSHKVRLKCLPLAQTQARLFTITSLQRRHSMYTLRTTVI